MENSKTPGLNFEGLNESLLEIAGELLLKWLPGGNMATQTEFACADLNGGPPKRSGGGSLRVNITNGLWSDFATGEGGRDLISLYAAVFGTSQKQAFWDLRRMNEGILPARKVKIPRIAPKPPRFKPPPDDCKPPVFKDDRFGEPKHVWTYKDVDGKNLFHIARYESRGNKEFIPFSWNGKGWAKKLWLEPRPLYGLWRLRRNMPVLIVEGEKAADAADLLMSSSYDVLSWPNGASAIDKADWSPLYKRQILLWPDADRRIANTIRECGLYNVDEGDPIPVWAQAGTRAMLNIAKKLDKHCPEIKIIDIPFDDPFTSAFHGFDAADALELGWKFKDVVDWARPKAKVIEAGRHPSEPARKLPNFFPSPTRKPLPAISLPVEEDPTIPKVKAKPIVEVPTRRLVDPEVLPKNQGSIEDDDIPRSVMAIWEEIGLCTSDQGKPIYNLDNVLRILENWGPLKNLVWWDTFHRKIFTHGYGKEPEPTREWDDVDDLNIAAKLQREIRFQRVTDDVIHKAIIVYAHKHPKNEPKDWMEGLKWDGSERVDQFFIKYFGTPDTAYHRAVSMNFWVSLIARIYRPGCKSDNMVIIEGGQGKFKSTALTIIGGTWYTEVTESVTSKDFYLSLQGKVLVEFSEMDAFSRVEKNTIKKILSCKIDRFRPPYGRLSKDFPRQCVFVATTNDEEYLKDHTGARRFWPVRITEIDVDQLKEDREQLFAEAVKLFKEGKTWHEVPIEEAKAHQEHRRSSDEWEAIIAAYLTGKLEVTTMEIGKEALSIEVDRLDHFTQVRISRVMQLLGWKRKSVRRFDRVLKVWVNNNVDRIASVHTIPQQEEIPLPDDDDTVTDHGTFYVDDEAVYDNETPTL